ncbi:MAG: diacylglycerol kinase [Verrucomicrobia bacterium]|nr:diacylglycerol kinase [Verrucomicrobiota bacterium]|tara:strand:- start:440 stop:934 length:495 start_codon:yes stop_codon:yes gene_type:complete
MIISLIVAVSENNVIGRDNDLPWRLPDDMKFFVKTTKGHHILGGRKNFESFGKALPYRTNLLISRNANYSMEGVHTFTEIEEAIEFAKSNDEEELIVIGGGEIYRKLLPLSSKIYLTRIHAHIEGDVYFPKLESGEWEVESKEYHPIDEKHPYAFTIYSLKRTT